MHFSATISFFVGLILITMGILAISKAKSVYHLMFASIPIIFGGQQIIEAFLWVVIQHSAYVETAKDLSYLYLFSAEVIWPVWIPLSILQMEKNAALKLIQIVLLSIGLFVSGYLTFCILTFNIDAKIVGSHIHYIQHYLSPFTIFKSIPYLVAAILPFFFSSFKKMWVIGIGLFASYIVAKVFYAEFLVSIWSLFAATTSILVYPVILDAGKEVEDE